MMFHSNHRYRFDPRIFDHAVSSHIGYGRSRNEDAVWHTPGRYYGSGRGLLWAVADGMGGHSAGDIAAQAACEQLALFYTSAGAGDRRAVSEPELRRRLERTLLRADRHIRRMAMSSPELNDMGTTLSCLLMTSEHSIIGHVGDSRIYRLRSDRLHCLTTDHTFVQEMIFEGEIDPRDALTHPLRHVLTQAVGTAEPLMQVDTRIDRLWPEDCFLLCTDGLTTAVNESRIADLLNQPTNAAETAAALVTEALHHRTKDNVTAVVVKVKQKEENGEHGKLRSGTTV